MSDIEDTGGYRREMVLTGCPLSRPVYPGLPVECHSGTLLRTQLRYDGLSSGHSSNFIQLIKVCDQPWRQNPKKKIIAKDHGTNNKTCSVLSEGFCGFTAGFPFQHTLVPSGLQLDKCSYTSPSPADWKSFRERGRERKQRVHPITQTHLNSS